MPQALQSPIRISGESRTLRRFRLDCAVLAAAGAGRARNDSHVLFAAPGSEAAEVAGAGYLFGVSDEDPAYRSERSAARETVTSLLEILDDPRRLELRPDLLMHRLQDANDRCRRYIRGRCSATLVWVWEEPAGDALVAAWAHVGDARLYHHGRSGWKALTRDQAKGRILDRAIGQGDGLEIATGRLSLFPGERLALLNRGVWSAAPPASVLPREPFPGTAEAVRRLVGQARLNGSRIDTSAIVITARGADAGPEPEH